MLFPANLFSSLSWSSFQMFTEIYEIDLTRNKVFVCLQHASKIKIYIKWMNNEWKYSVLLVDFSIFCCIICIWLHLNFLYIFMTSCISSGSRGDPQRGSDPAQPQCSPAGVKSSDVPLWRLLLRLSRSDWTLPGKQRHRLSERPHLLWTQQAGG